VRLSLTQSMRLFPLEREFFQGSMKQSLDGPSRIGT
jgi:hypothetical protein